MSSFQKRRTTPLLPGGKHSLHTGQQLVSTGNPALDYVLGGGLPIGSILLIEEDKIGRYAKCLSKLFLAEGIVHKHALFLANLDQNPQEMLKKLPPMIPEKSTSPSSSSSSSTAIHPSPSAQPPQSSSSVNDEMRIAWRYNNLNKVDSEQGGTSQTDAKNAYTFDLSQSIDDGALKDLDITLFGKDESNHHSDVLNSIFHNPAYVSLIQKLRGKMTDSIFGVSSQTAAVNSTAPATATTSKKNLLRICIESLGSPLWYDEHFARDFCLFLSVLKAAVRVSLSVCCITVPAYLFKYIDPTLLHRVRNLVDYAIELESFAGSEKETNPVFKEYNGLFFIRKMAALNTLASHTPETYDLAFKLRRRRFVIEKLHLPPELQDSEQREQDDEPISASLGCASNKKHLFEF